MQQYNFFSPLLLLLCLSTLNFSVQECHLTESCIFACLSLSWSMSIQVTFYFCSLYLHPETTIFVSLPPSLPSLDFFSLLTIFHFYHTCPLLLHLHIIYTEGSTRLIRPVSWELVRHVRIVGEARHYICPPPNYSLKPTEDLWVVFSPLQCVCVVWGFLFCFAFLLCLCSILVWRINSNWQSKDLLKHNFINNFINCSRQQNTSRFSVSHLDYFSGQ